jgi:DNA-binding NtrC family response regulator
MRSESAPITGNQTKFDTPTREAARQLGISRQTMRSKLRSLGLTVNLALEIDDETA